MFANVARVKAREGRTKVVESAPSRPFAALRVAFHDFLQANGQSWRRAGGGGEAEWRGGGGCSFEVLHENSCQTIYVLMAGKNSSRPPQPPRAQEVVK